MALAAPSVSAWADEPANRYSADYHYSSYTEDDLERAKGLAGGEISRYQIDMHQFSLRVPSRGRWDVAIDVVHETMSGASPQFSVPDAAGEPVQVMSGATISEERNDLLMQWNRYLDNGRLGFSGGLSTEKDYRAINLGLDGETHFNEGNTTLSAGVGMSYDTIEPTDAALFSTRPTNENKQSYSMMMGLSQLLNRGTLLQTSLTYKHSAGYLSDPYKQVFVVGGTFLPDSRPVARNQLSWLSRFRGHVAEIGGTIHADYQFHFDDWGISSHTFELAWYQKVKRVTIVPAIRYYSQTQANFYEPFFNTLPNLTTYSSDFRLAAYGSLTLGLKAEYVLPTRWTKGHDLVLLIAFDRYISSEDLALEKDVQEAPGLVSYSVLSVGLGLRW